MRDFPRREFSSEYVTETLLCYSSLFFFLLLLLAFIVLLQNKHTTQNGENLISAQPRISAPSQDPKI